MLDSILSYVLIFVIALLVLKRLDFAIKWVLLWASFHNVTYSRKSVNY